MFALQRLSSVARVALKLNGQRRCKVPVRHVSDWSYRGSKLKETNITYERMVDLMFFTMWYWILYHFATDWQHITGTHFGPWADPNKWTDEELGIPPENEDV